MLSKSKELIHHLAFQNAKNIVFYSEEDYLYKKSSDPHEIYCKIVLGKEFSVSNITHSRAIDLVRFFEPIILNINGKSEKPIYIKCNLHDSHYDRGTLCFGSKKQDKCVLIPDLYHMGGYNGNLDKPKAAFPSFDKKVPKIVFAGSSTGSLSPYENTRLNTAVWSKSDLWARSFTDIFLTNMVQMKEEEVGEFFSLKSVSRESIMKSFMSIDEQLTYKYILSIDGNTWAWDRPVWVMNQNSVLMKYDSNQVGWYYPCLKENFHYIPVNMNNMEKQYTFLENNPNQSREIISQAQQFVKSFCTPIAYQVYLKYLIQYVFEKYNS